MIITTQNGIRVIEVGDEKFEVRVIKFPIDFCKASPALLVDLERTKDLMDSKKNPKLYNVIDQQIALLAYSLGMWSENEQLQRSDTPVISRGKV